MQLFSKSVLTIINSDASPFPKDLSLKEASVLRNLQDYVVTLLRGRGRRQRRRERLDYDPRRRLHHRWRAGDERRYRDAIQSHGDLPDRCPEL